MPTGTPYSTLIRESLIQYVREGHSYHEAKEEFKVSYPTVVKWCSKAGVRSGKPRPRGFATFSREKMLEVCRKGGKAAQASGAGRRFNSETGRIAGRKGGLRHSKKHMAELGRKGGAITALKHQTI